MTVELHKGQTVVLLSARHDPFPTVDELKICLARPERTEQLSVYVTDESSDDTGLKMTVRALSRGVRGFIELHPHDQVQMARQALEAGVVFDTRTERQEEKPQ